MKSREKKVDIEANQRTQLPKPKSLYERKKRKKRWKI